MFNKIKNNIQNLYDDYIIGNEYDSSEYDSFVINGKTKDRINLSVEYFNDAKFNSKNSFEINYTDSEFSYRYIITTNSFILRYTNYGCPERYESTIITNSLSQLNKIIDETSEERFSTELLIKKKLPNSVLLRPIDIVNIQNFLTKVTVHNPNEKADIVLHINNLMSIDSSIDIAKSIIHKIYENLY